MGRSIPCVNSIERLRAPPTPSSEVANEFKSKILLVEDETLTRLMLAERFEALGHTVVEAADADEALSLLRDGNTFDLLFTDIKMPGAIDGLDLVRLVRAEFPGLKVIIGSAHAGLSGWAIEADAAFEKPYELDHLFAEIKQLLDSHATRAADVG